MPRIAFWLLAGANFSVALGYGAIVPLLPTVLASYGSAGALLSWHTGGLLGAYMLGLFFAAPVWGALSDRIGGQRLLVFGLGAYAASLVAFAGAGDLPTAYLWRVLAGCNAVDNQFSTVNGEAGILMRVVHPSGSSAGV